MRYTPVNSPANGSHICWRSIRIVDPTSAPNVDITWSTSGVPTSLDSNFKPKVNIYVDTDNAGYDGTFIGRADFDAGTFSFPSAILPPGDYYYYTTLMENWTSGDTLLAQSPYSAKFTITEPTRISFTHPNYTSGEDYATAVVGDPWDFDNEADVPNLGSGFNMDQRNFDNHSFADGAFKARAIIPDDKHTAGQEESDSQVWMNINPSNPVDTSKYRWYTFTMKVDTTGTNYNRHQ